MIKNINTTEAYLKSADKILIIIHQKSTVIKIKKYLHLTHLPPVISLSLQFRLLIHLHMMSEEELHKLCVSNILKMNSLISVFLVTNQSAHNVPYMALTENTKFKQLEEQYQQSNKD
jgi:hypothetical protein